MVLTTIHLRPMQYNRRSLDDGREFIKKVMSHLRTVFPNPEIGQGAFALDMTLGVDYRADLDNRIKLIQDCIAEHFGFDDSRIFDLHAVKVPVKRGAEFFTFSLTPYKVDIEDTQFNMRNFNGNRNPMFKLAKARSIEMREHLISISHIAREVGVGDPTARNYVENIRIHNPIRPYDPDNCFDEYIRDSDYTITELSKKFMVAANWLYRYVEKHGIQREPRHARPAPVEQLDFLTPMQ